MIDRPLHLYFHSELDDPEQWRLALTEWLGEVKFSVGPHCEHPHTVDVALLWTTPKQGLAGFIHLKAVLSLGAGINQLDLSTLPEGVPVARLVDESLTVSMVEYARACVFRYHRELHRYEQDSRQRRWSFNPPVRAAQRCIGVLGLGRLGMAISSALIADGFEVKGWSNTSKDIAGLQSLTGETGLDALVGQVDILINVLPLTAQTSGILNQSLFARFSRPVQLINMGRGEHLIEDDLLSALALGQIEAATLDVTCIEPLAQTSGLWAHPQILITPHVAGLSCPRSAAQGIAENILKAMQMLPLINQVDLCKGY
ncbi:glyoxylate/hydroxypyruvate reductase A [Pseudomonas sp. CF161]|uniref:2-hydroxyacid dehydrogenase n=1 Tax=Pseudomonas sp. CF161 TaxID=911241 RepID=UPI000355375A|nr:glyoxylate/hydroxypyruvate reductase A [Pseudomonas sp. CF161]EPL15550.1 D-isomer specific 2-hydroxyacid dehydrogenase NAD-binding protein [Pseudomonas sp. CF161]